MCIRDRCKYCGSEEFTKETDIMDVWFDSGTSYASVIHDNPSLEWPVDLYPVSYTHLRPPNRTKPK